MESLCQLAHARCDFDSNSQRPHIHPLRVSVQAYITKQTPASRAPRAVWDLFLTLIRIEFTGEDSDAAVQFFSDQAMCDRLAAALRHAAEPELWRVVRSSDPSPAAALWWQRIAIPVLRQRRPPPPSHPGLYRLESFEHWQRRRLFEELDDFAQRLDSILQTEAPNLAYTKPLLDSNPQMPALESGDSPAQNDAEDRLERTAQTHKRDQEPILSRGDSDICSARSSEPEGPSGLEEIRSQNHFAAGGMAETSLQPSSSHTAKDAVEIGLIVAERQGTTHSDPGAEANIDLSNIDVR